MNRALGETAAISMLRAKPNQLRPPDIVQLNAAKPGHTGYACRLGQSWFFNVTEYPRLTECAPTP